MHKNLPSYCFHFTSRLCQHIVFLWKKIWTLNCTHFKLLNCDLHLIYAQKSFIKLKQHSKSHQLLHPPMWEALYLNSKIKTSFFFINIKQYLKSYQLLHLPKKFNFKKWPTTFHWRPKVWKGDVLIKKRYLCLCNPTKKKMLHQGATVCEIRQSSDRQEICEI